MPEYAFDVSLFAVLRVNAQSEREARAIMRDALDAATIAVDAGATACGQKIVGEASIDGELDLIEIDGEPS